MNVASIPTVGLGLSATNSGSNGQSSLPDINLSEFMDPFDREASEANGEPTYKDGVESIGSYTFSMELPGDFLERGGLDHIWLDNYYLKDKPYYDGNYILYKPTKILPIESNEVHKPIVFYVYDEYHYVGGSGNLITTDRQYEINIVRRDGKLFLEYNYVN